jgi:hypothetical protein
MLFGFIFVIDDFGGEDPIDPGVMFFRLLSLSEVEGRRRDVFRGGIGFVDTAGICSPRWLDEHCMS